MPEPIVTVAEMREREERTWATGVNRDSVILRAGVAVANVALRWSSPNDPVLVLAGSGQNGGDAVVAEQHLADRDATLARLPDVAACESARAWLDEHRGHRRALIVDGMFGIGLNRPLEEPWKGLVEAVNASGVRVLAVDIPSGLNADTGEPMGGAVRAAVTVTLGAVKQGLLKEGAAAFVGRLELAHDIGLQPGHATGGPLWALASDFQDFPEHREDNAHKGSFGHVAILAGSLGYHGAAVLAAQGAMRARPGLVTVFVDERCYAPVASQLRAAMVRPWRGEPLEPDRFTAVVAGPGMASPGLSPAIRDEVRRLWRTASCPVVADATALDWLGSEAPETKAWRVVTPHPGEAGRLLGTDARSVQNDRFGAVRALVQHWGGGRLGVVLKGRLTLTADAEGPICINSSGNPGLAQGGTGDLLSGFLGGLLAPRISEDRLMHTVRYGVWRHGATADALDATGRLWTTEDLAEALAHPLH